MKSIFLAATLAVFAVGAASAGTMDNMIANSVNLTDSAGVQTHWTFTADGTYHMTGANGASATGTYTSDATHFCMTPAGGQQACHPAMVEGKNVGDTWQVTDPDGKTATLTIVAGH